MMTITHAEMPMGFPWIVIVSRSSERSEEAAWQSQVGGLVDLGQLGSRKDVGCERLLYCHCEGQRPEAISPQSISCGHSKANLKYNMR